jgi:hypothetical protein
MPELTPKQRMLNAYRGVPSDRPPVAPEFWFYYPAKVLGVDMIEFSRRPFHLALKATFEKFSCEGWGTVGCGVPAPDVERRTEEHWAGPDTLIRRTTVRTPAGELTCASRHDRHEPSWAIERPIKDFDRDLPAYEHATLGGDAAAPDPSGAVRDWREVGASYLLEASLGVPFFDYFAEARQGGLEQAVFDFAERADRLADLQRRYIDHRVRLAAALCEKTPFESFFIGCSWSCNSLIGPRMWRRWDRPVIAAVADELHRRGRLLHVHVHGRCMETVGDFAAIGVDCVCPFERPPGGDVAGGPGLRAVRRILAGRTTFNGNVHTVETLIRGRAEDVRREVREILDAFAGESRVIVGTGDQVGRETPEENLWAMIEEVKQDARDLSAEAAREGGCGG